MVRAKGGYQQRRRDKARQHMVDALCQYRVSLVKEKEEEKEREKLVHQSHVPESVSGSTSSLLCPDTIEALIRSSVIVAVVLLLLFHLRGECHFLFSDDGRTTRWLRF